MQSLSERTQSEFNASESCYEEEEAQAEAISGNSDGNMFVDLELSKAVRADKPGRISSGRLR